MKKIIFFLFITFIYADISNLVKIINNLEIKPKIINITDYNPYCEDIKNIILFKTHSNLSFEIKAILNDKIFIGNRWYKVGDKIGGYKIYKITPNFVILKRANKMIKLNLYKKLF